MVGSLFFWLLLVPGTFLVLQYLHFAWLTRWTDRNTQGLNYYGRSSESRKRFKRWLAFHAACLVPIRRLLANGEKFQFNRGTFQFRGVPGPKAGSCSMATFEQASRFQPLSSDVFVVTQMRSGTTWMQHLVFQILTRGTVDLAAEDTCLNAISPWIESDKTVSVDNAPKVGVDQAVAKRILKTHLPASLCPFDKEAKYIHVVRHPVSCFASCVDFVHSNLRGFEPDLDDCLRWFLSPELMWWGTWQEHLRGWYERGTDGENVLLVRFEDMKSELPKVIHRVAEFLDVSDLQDAEVEVIARRCGFEYMRTHADLFEMHPPHILQIPNRFFVSGRTDSETQLPTFVREQIIEAWGDAFPAGEPLADLYPDCVTATSGRAHKDLVEVGVS